MRKVVLAVVLAALAAAGAARSAVVDANPSGFQVKETVEIAAPADRVWNALGHIGAWWNPDHTWSKDARNLRLELVAGGCLCEALANGTGAARHMTVIFVVPEKTAILEGTLGPLMFSGSSGHLVWSLTEADGKTTLSQIYYVGGYIEGGFVKLAPAVDGVLTDQLARLKAYAEAPPPPPPPAATPPTTTPTAKPPRPHPRRHG